MSDAIRSKFTINFSSDDIIALAIEHIYSKMGIKLDSSRFATLACAKASIDLAPEEIDDFYRRKYSNSQDRNPEEVRLKEFRTGSESRGLKLLVFASVREGKLVLTEIIDVSTDCNSIIDFSKMPFQGDSDEILAKDGFLGNSPPEVDGFGEEIQYVELNAFSSLLGKWYKNCCGGTRIVNLACERLDQIRVFGSTKEFTGISPLVGLYFYQASKQIRDPH